MGENGIEIRDEIVLRKCFVMYKYTQLLNHPSSYQKSFNTNKKGGNLNSSSTFITHTIIQF